MFWLLAEFSRSPHIQARVKVIYTDRSQELLFKVFTTVYMSTELKTMSAKLCYNTLYVKYV